jgi:hypothetical protein
MREIASVEKDGRLPVSSLVWLLGQIEKFERSTDLTLETFRYILNEDKTGILSEYRWKDEVQWTVIFDSITRSILPVGQNWEKEGFTPDEYSNLMTLFQMISVIEDEITLKGQVWALLTGYPFDQELEQSKPLGLAIRFAAWKHKRAFSRDSSSSWPKELFFDICKLHRNEFPSIIQVLLKELRKLIKPEPNENADITHCLTMLWETLDLDDSRPLAKEIRSTMISTSLSLSLAGAPGPASPDLMETVTAILRQDKNRFQSHVQAVILQLLLDLSAFNCDTHVTLFQILQHESLRGLWTSGMEIYPLHPPSSKMHFRPYVGSLYPVEHVSTYPWAVQLAAAVKNTIDNLPRGVTESNDEWKILTLGLETLAICLGATGLTTISDLTPNELSQDRRFEWLLNVLSTLSSQMVDEKFGFIISSLLTGSVRNLFRNTLYCSAGALSEAYGPSSISRQRLELRCSNPSLIFAACGLLGWKYGPSLPDCNQPIWASRTFKAAFAHWDNYEPHMFLDCDKGLLSELGARRDDDFWDDYVIMFLQRRARQNKRVSSVRYQKFSSH